MTVTSTNNRNDYTAAAAQTVFPYTMKIFANSDLQVYDDTVLQTLNSDYTVSGAGDEGGGNVTFLVGMTGGEAIAIVRDVPATQLIDYTPYTDFPAESAEDGFDKTTILAQQNEEEQDRTIKYDPSYGGATGKTLLAPVANEILGFDAAGELTTYTFSGDAGSLDLAVNLASNDVGKGSDLVARAGSSPAETVTESFTAVEADVATNTANITQNASDIAVLQAFDAKSDEIIGLTLNNNSVDSDHDIDVVAGECNDSVRAVGLVGASDTKAIDQTWTEGALGGFPDQGGSGLVLTADTRYNFFIIAKPDGTTDYGFDSNLDASVLLNIDNAGADGYTLYRRLGTALTDSSANIYEFEQQGNNFFYPSGIQHTPLTAGAGVAIGSTTIDALWPDQFDVVGLIDAWWYLGSNVQPGTDALRYGFIGSTDLAVTTPSATLFNIAIIEYGSGGVADGGTGVDKTIRVPTSDGQVVVETLAASATQTLKLTTRGWVDRRID